MKQLAYIGKDSIKELIPILRKYNVKHVFLVRGKGSYVSCGAQRIINDAISQYGCGLTEFYDFSENPKCEDMERGIEMLKRCEADIIIAVGGGSVLDMAKLVRFFSCYIGEVTGKCFEKNQELLPLVAIPTTAGTGAEATHFAVVYKNKVKYSAEHDDMLPDYAIIYSPFTYGNPRYLTACTGFDALAQAIEAFWNLNATEESDVYAERAIRLLWPNLADVVNNPNDELRDKVSEGSYWAGRAINITKTTAPHAFSYPFTTYYGYPHGHAVALTFPFFMQHNCSDLNPNRIRINKLLSVLSFDESTNLFSEMRNYINIIGLCKKDTNINSDIVLRNINVDRLNNNPVNLHSDSVSLVSLFKYL